MHQGLSSRPRLQRQRALSQGVACPAKKFLSLPLRPDSQGEREEIDREERKPLGMRERLIAPIPPSVPGADWDWVDVRKVALVEVTSEDKTHPIESALVGGEKRGWRAAEPGPHTIRLLFRQAAKGQTDSAGFRGNRTQAHSGVHPPLVSGRWSNLIAKSCASSGISVRPGRCARSRITLSSSLMLRCLS